MGSLLTDHFNHDYRRRLIKGPIDRSITNFISVNWPLAIYGCSSVEGETRILSRAQDIISS